MAAERPPSLAERLTDVEAERNLIGRLLVWPADVEEAVTELDPTELAHPSTKVAFQAIGDLWLADAEITAVSVAKRATDIDPSFNPGELVQWMGERDLGTTSSLVTQLRRLAVNRELYAKIQIAFKELSRPQSDGLAIASELGVALDQLGGRGDGELALSSAFDVAARPEAEVPWVIPGLLYSEDALIIVAGEGAGKALAVETPVLLADGTWVKLRDVRAGMRVFDRFGQPTTVRAAFDAYEAETYRVEFSDGSVLLADARHEWITSTYRERQRQSGSCRSWPTGVRTTRDISETLRARGFHSVNHSVPTCGPLHFEGPDLPIPPYTLGAWLGDGTSGSGSITCVDEEILDQIRADGYLVRPTGEPITHRIALSDDGLIRQIRVLTMTGYTDVQVARHLGVGRGFVRRHGVNGMAAHRRKLVPAPAPNLRSFSAQLRDLGVLGAKRIPPQYLKASIPDRIALLQGLVDTDGHVGSRNGDIELTFKEGQLARDAEELALGLGLKVTSTLSEMKIDGRTVGVRRRIRWISDFPPARLSRKLAAWVPPRTQRGMMRYITAVVPTGERQWVRCLAVDSPDHSWLAGERLIPTHNSVMARQVALCAEAGLHPFTRHPIEPVRTLTIDLENKRRAMTDTFRLALTAIRGTEGRANWQPQGPVWEQPGGMNLLNGRDRRRLQEAIRRTRPDLVFFGPIYKSFRPTGGMKDDAAALEVTNFFDELRAKFGFGMWIEAHAPFGDGASRDLRPFGTTLWQRWPEYGKNFRHDSKSGHLLVGSFRGDRSRVYWPDRLLVGKDSKGGFPFTGKYERADLQVFGWPQ